ncbi:hypothetical protein OV079_53065 [Nannocystis pusilla]|uniref:Uncharacterized protein n=1 Tax=Nannocystis pusilla TaxID=889268 RepID=A0A9X3J4A8_9BACT|nr:hypothetical protein [Nannocystis pusilla]
MVAQGDEVERRAGGDVGDEAPVPGDIFTHDRGGGGDRRVLGQDGLDLAELDPHPAQLHLGIAAADVLEVAVEVAAPDRRCGTSVRP